MGCHQSTLVQETDDVSPKDAPVSTRKHSRGGTPGSSKIASERSHHLREQLVRDSNARWEDTYIQEAELGHGMTGKVYRIRHRTTGDKFALKCLEANKFDADLLGDLINEIELLRKLDHPNVIRLYEYFYDGPTIEESSNIYLVMELCEGGELFDRLHAQRGSHYTERQAAHIVFMMLSAVAYCHSCGISHRDLKLENFLFESRAEDANLKLIDFGLSRKYGASLKRMHTMVGTPYYIAPEVLEHSHKGYTNTCDMWSVGVIAYMLLSGTPPFKGRHDQEVLSSVKRGKYTLSGRRWVNISEDAKNFIRRCLVYNPKKRYKAPAALKDPWIVKHRAVRRMESGSHILDPEIMQSLRAFAQFSSLKRTALQAIAFQMNASKLSNLREVFLDMDTNKTGMITLQEMKEALVQEGGMDEKEIERIFDDIDADHDRNISYSEFLAATLSERLYQREEYIRAAFQKLDVDHTGSISVSNLHDVLGDEFNSEAADAMIREADSKGDGCIDYEEFLSLFREESHHLVPGVNESSPSSTNSREFQSHAARFLGPPVEETGSIVLEGGPSHRSNQCSDSLSVSSAGGGSIAMEDGESVTSKGSDDTSVDDIDVHFNSHDAKHNASNSTNHADERDALGPLPERRFMNSEGQRAARHTRKPTPSPLRHEWRYHGKAVEEKHHDASTMNGSTVVNGTTENH